MKCPFCNYFHGYCSEKQEIVKGEVGDFHYLPVKMEREIDYQTERISLFACPSCKKVFIES